MSKENGVGQSKMKEQKKRVINKQSGINLWSNYITFRYATVATNSHERCYGCTALWGEKVFPINGIQISKFIEKKTVHTFYYRKYDTIINEHLQPIGALDSNNYRIWYTKCNGPLCVINMRYQWRMTNGVVNEHSHCIASGNKKGDVGYRGSIWTFIFSFLVADLRPIGMPFIVGKYVTNTVFSALTADEWVDE